MNGAPCSGSFFCRVSSVQRTGGDSNGQEMASHVSALKHKALFFLFFFGVVPAVRPCLIEHLGNRTLLFGLERLFPINTFAWLLVLHLPPNWHLDQRCCSHCAWIGRDANSLMPFEQPLSSMDTCICTCIYIYTPIYYTYDTSAAEASHRPVILCRSRALNVTILPTGRWTSSGPMSGLNHTIHR